MALRANFEIIKFNEHLGDNENDLPAFQTVFVGNQTTLYNFNIEQEPVGQGYLTIQTFDVNRSVHIIQINGTELPGDPDLPDQPDFSIVSWTTPIGLDVLRAGNNTIRILRGSGGDNFHVYSVIINWKEETNTGLLGLFAFVGKFFKRHLK